MSQQQARISRTLRIHPLEVEEAFWSDEGVNRIRRKLDRLGALMTLAVVVVTNRQLKLHSSMQGWLGLYVLPVVAGTLALLSLGFRNYCNSHNTAVVLNRFICTSCNCFLVWTLSRDDAVKLVTTAPTNSVSVFINLLLLSPLVQLLLSTSFAVPFTFSLLIHLMTVAASASWGYHCACAFSMQQLPGEVLALAITFCNGIDWWMDLWYYFMSQVSGVPGSVLSGSSTTVCTSRIAGPLLVTYSNLLVCFLLPVLALFVLEYVSKVRFLKSRQVQVLSVDWSPVLLLPNCLTGSCMLAVLMYPALLWHLLTSVAPMMSLKC